jgi:hypothetical protein
MAGKDEPTQMEAGWTAIGTRQPDKSVIGGGQKNLKGCFSLTAFSARLAALFRRTTQPGNRNPLGWRIKTLRRQPLAHR